MQPHAICVEPRDQPVDALGLRLLDLSLQPLTVILDLFVDVDARLTHFLRTLCGRKAAGERIVPKVMKKLEITLVALMRAAWAWDPFYRLLNRAFPEKGQTLELALDD